MKPLSDLQRIALLRMNAGMLVGGHLSTWNFTLRALATKGLVTKDRRSLTKAGKRLAEQLTMGGE